MSGNKTFNNIETHVKYLLTESYSCLVKQEYLSEIHLNAETSTIRHASKKIEKHSLSALLNNENPKFSRLCRINCAQMVRCNASHIDEESFPDIQSIVTRYRISVATTIPIIHDKNHAQEGTENLLDR
ncbi:unnamed protein product [Rotaria magnacalcarata]|uniref:Uncharacterized protein n=1 Tax=Rotaria magnacalcarata TaxID=392030 RepID=A0A819AY15_9BILA|nr:unnamed protein product [Rotaria magnacalcarata]CAF2119546.1 unnamed protein product [Rotaria magnacalcarata]CAF3792375.1 unnamed protein product [Rotaria magnacalcarata]CAF3866415.1 unnamed protein product [Rotaria magnacalcarata]